MPLSRVWIPSPNYSSRAGTRVRLVVVHTAEGSRNFRDLGAYFANPASQVSSQTGIDDTPGQIGEYVTRDAKPWTQGNANPYSTSTELCAFAKWDPAEWSRHPVMLDNCAQWIAEECAYFGIPAVKLSAAQAQGGAAGVCGHVDLGAAGGGHWDPGPDFPWATVLAGSATPAPTPPSSDWSEENMICVDPKTGGTWCVSTREGAVNAEGGAPYIGGCNNTAMNAGKYPCVGIDLRPGGDGFRLVLDWGDGGGGKSKDGTGRRYRTYDFPYNGSGAVTGGTY